jgi:hypothetical protein
MAQSAASLKREEGGAQGCTPYLNGGVRGGNEGGAVCYVLEGAWREGGEDGTSEEKRSVRVSING